MTRAAFLKELQEENAGWEALLGQIGEDRMESGIQEGGWTVKDIVAHMTGWRKRTVSRLQAALNHQAVPPPPWPANLHSDDDNVDEINEWIYQANKDRSLEDVLQDSRDIFQQLYQTLEAFPEPELQELTRLDWLEGEPLSGALFFGHFHDEHEAALRAWAWAAGKQNNSPA